MLLLTVWPDIEEAVLEDAWSYGPSLAEAVRQAFRIEVQEEMGLVDTELGYVLLFDIESYDARRAAAALKVYQLDSVVREHAPVRGNLRRTEVRIVPRGKPIEGDVCPRVITPAAAVPDLQDLPEPMPPATSVPLVTRGLHRLTPIEAPFYDALQETGLVFAVQPRVQGDHTYRPDFIVFYAGRAIVVELDGHEGHKTKQQRSDDAKRELWFKQKGLSVLRWTGSQVTASPKNCVDQLLLVLRGGEARP